MKSLCFLMALACCAPAQGQSEFSAIAGKLSDPDGGPVGIGTAIFVIATNTSTRTVSRAEITNKSEYSFPRLIPGVYDLSVPLPCCQYTSYARNGVAVKAGETLHLDLAIPWGPNLGTLGDDPLSNANQIRGPEVSGPTPRTREGKPDLTGMWLPAPNINTPATPAPLQPWAAALLKQRTADNNKDAPGAYCLPSRPLSFMVGFPYKVIQTPALIVILTESDTPGHRQIFMDGRPHPADPNPTWLGHSIATWDRDTLVIDSVGFNDKSWLSFNGVGHTEKLHAVERIRRPDYGHLDIEIVLEDADAFTAQWKITTRATLAQPGEEIIEFLCSENNKDTGHLVGK